MADVPSIRLRPHKAAAFWNRHPWVLAKSVVPPDAEPAPGAVVDLHTPDGRFIARGLYNGHSHLRVRLYSWTPGEELDDVFWRRRIATAVELRRTLGYLGAGTACRLVFSEADGLSGLVVERYGDYLVVQVAAAAIAARIDRLVPILVELLQPKGILLRTDRKIAAAEGIEPIDRLAWGENPSGPLLVDEHGLSYEVDLAGGQKTGLYLDQHENRRAAAAYCRGRRVLDVFSYVGGFALAAARLGGAAEVLGIDESQRAVDQATANAARNGLINVRFEAGEAFRALEDLAAAGRRFEAVILDPPRFAGGKPSIDAALRAYHRLNRLGVGVLEPGGILVTCSCSGRVTRSDFAQMLFGVAQKTRRDVQVLEVRGAAPDHPVSVACPETEYLKCFICRVG